jgi:hypothetical protein
MAKLLHLVSDGDNFVVNPANIDSISGDTNAVIFSGSSVATVTGVSTVDVVAAINEAVRSLSQNSHVTFLTVDLGGEGISVAEVGAA